MDLFLQEVFMSFFEAFAAPKTRELAGVFISVFAVVASIVLILYEIRKSE